MRKHSLMNMLCCLNDYELLEADQVYRGTGNFKMRTEQNGYEYERMESYTFALPCGSKEFNGRVELRKYIPYYLLSLALDVGAFIGARLVPCDGNIFFFVIWGLPLVL